MRRLYSALISLGLTTVVTMTHAQLPFPAFHHSWSGFIASVTGLYVKPSVTGDDLDYATFSSVGTDPEVGGDFISRRARLEPDYSWDWGASLGYVFPGTANDITASYLHFGDTRRDSVHSPDTGFEVDPVNFSGNPAFVFATAVANLDLDLDQVTLTTGQTINFGNRLTIHPQGGGEYLSLKRKLNSVFNSFPQEIDQTNLAIFEDTDFKGIGPMVGVDLGYYLDDNIGIVGHFNSALLVGHNTAATNAIQRSILSTPFDIDFKQPSSYRIVPEVDAKIGASYTYLFPNHTTNLSLEGGYQVNHYFNPFQRLNTGYVSGMGGPTSSFIAGATTADFGFQGPYISLVLHT